jgi:phosphoglycerate dehydrogenase-like enzyme
VNELATPETAPLRILMSEGGRRQTAAGLAAALGGRPHRLVGPGEDADLAFVSRDITGGSTKHEVWPETKRYYDTLLAAPRLRWVQLHSAGADRPVYQELHRRGVAVTTASGANAGVVVQTALAGLLSLARGFPAFARAQREHRWAPLILSGLPRDLAAQTALIVGWGPIGRQLGRILRELSLRIAVVRGGDEPAEGAEATVPYERIGELLPRADWLLLACPLTERTRGLVDAAALARLPPGAHLVNVARGEVVVERALVEALARGTLAGAHLDTFEHEPLPADSPLWDLPNVIVSPHSAGQSDGNEARVAGIFLDNLARWCRGEPLRHLVA